MTISKKIGTGFAVIALGALLAVACNDSSSGDTTAACTGACNHVLNCVYGALADAGLGMYIPDAGSYCQDSCAAGTDAGTQCTNPAAAFNCISSLSCAQIGTSGGSADLIHCEQEAGCPDAG